MATKKTTNTRRNKYHYYKVLQGNYGYGWDDLIYLETNSTGVALDEKEKKDFWVNKKLYRENERGVRFRVIFRKENK